MRGCDDHDIDAPDGVSIQVADGHPHVFTRLDPMPIADLHADAVLRAWRQGSWDIAVTRHPPLDIQSLGMLTANAIWDDALLLEELLDAATRGTLISWLWLPMREGPHLRRRAHQSKDATLNADGGRSGDVPSTLTQPRLAGRGGSRVVIRLGRHSDAEAASIRKRHPRKADQTSITAAQRSYIGGLRRRLGMPDILLNGVGRVEASAMIDHLLAQQQDRRYRQR
ncbi:hypothetical protein [Sphingobium amiense]|nr:hypothetical protein [Sphingobium amiense]